MITPQQRYAQRWPLRLISAVLKHRHGISLSDYNRMSALQKGRCAICGKRPKPRANANRVTLKPPRLDVDHNHKTAALRGLLCNNCNRGLGHFHESVQLLRAAINYIEKYDTN